MSSEARRIELKSEKDLQHMRHAGRLAGQVLEKVGEAVRPGIKTKELDRLAEKFIRAAGGIPTFLGYRGYPACLCVSINEEVVHGIPDASRMLREGDIVSVDVGVTLEGFVGDTAATFAVGKVPAESQKLLDVTRECLRKGIEQARVGGRLGDVSHAIQEHAESRGYGVVRDYVGHGIGRQMHEEPVVPNYGSPRTGVRLEAGMTLALEPMITLGHWKVRVLDNGWTVVTQDGKRAGHFEHTVAITSAGPEILTLPH
ncbi:MAG TPA: type I methionyl aminopeptidase [Elusimicrobiota bacterium]|nr:type I methionyl aminopeptidase [Elusimicrobiota bacterium]